MRDEVPGAALEDETKGVQGALHDAGALAVARIQPALLPRRRRDRRQVRDGVLGTEPTAGVEMKVALGAARTLLELRGQRREHLQACIGEHAAEPELGCRRRCDEERLRLGRGEPGELRPIAAGEAIAAGRSPHGLDGHAGGGERFDVAMDRPHGDLEVRGQLLCGELPAHLQEEKQRNEPRRPHRAGRYMTEAGMYICQAVDMSDEREEQQSELEREERRLERLRLVVVPHPDVWEDEDPDPQQAA
jgi:hypothetical protein